MDTRISVARIEALEPRQLLSSAFSAEEVYLVELINRARSDPQAEGVRLSMDLTEDLTSEQLALFGPAEPLALNAALSEAARAHSLDMVNRGFFDHINPDGQNPTQRARAAGYAGVAGETIASGQPSMDALYASWLDSAPNRLNLLSLFPEFTESFHYDHIGPGFATDVWPTEDHFTALFGDPGAGSTAWLLGVVYDDADGDEFYTVGEGTGGVRIDVAAEADPGAVVATFTTDDAGNYQIELGDGSWIVTFTEIASGELVQKQVTTSGENVKLDALESELAPPPVDDDDGGGSDDGGGGNDDGGGGGSGDDHAEDGDYGAATLVGLDAGGSGEATGVVDPGTDTDLFYFSATFAGELRVTLDGSGGALLASLTLKSDVGLSLAAEAASASGGTVSLVWNVPAGAQYFLVVGSADLASVGAYGLAVSIADPSDDSGGGGNDDGGGGNDGGGGGSDDGGGGNDDGGSGDDGGENRWDEDPPVDATSDGSGALTIVRTDENGRPIVYFQNEDGAWASVDLIGEAGGPTPDGRFSTFVDPSTGRASVVSATPAGLALYSRDSDGVWRVRNLSVELGAPPIESKPVTFTSRTGLVFMAGLDAEGNLVTYSHTGALDSEGGREWGFEDLTTDHLAAQGLVMPALSGGTLIAYVTAWNGLTLAGLDEDGNVHAAWWAPGMQKWTLSNLSRITGAPSYQGTISAYLTPWQGINIAGTDESGDLAVVWWVPGFGGEWRMSRLNRILGGPRLLEGTIASWVTPWGGLNISGLTEEGKVLVYWWSPGSDGWKITPLSDYIPDVDPPVRGVIGHTSSRGEISILGLSAADELVRYWWSPGERWAGETLSLAE